MFIQVSSSSGKLQLSDATGSIDVVVIDMPSIWDFNTIYEVEDFNVIMQGVPHKLYHLDLITAESFTCRSIFSGAPSKKETKLSLHLCYNFRDQQPRYDIYSPCTNGKGCPEPECGRFHLLWLEHKYSLLGELVRDDALSNRSSVIAEAIVLPWDLTFGKEDEIEHLSSASLNQPKNSIKYYGRDRLEKDIIIKKCKNDGTLNSTLDSERSNAGNMISCLSESTSCSNSYSDEKFCDLSSRFPCLVFSRNFKVRYQGFLHCRDRKAMKSSGCKPDGRKVFLEFGSESFFMYEGLRIGGYYIVRQNEKDLLCTIKDGHNIAYKTFFITSKTCFWSLSFSSCEVVSNSESSAEFLLGGSSVYDNELLPDVYQHQSSSQIFSEVNTEFCSDINLFIPVDMISYLKVDLELSNNDRTSTYASFQGERDIHNGNKLFVVEPKLLSGSFHSDILLPEGDLISLHGHVLAVYEFNHGSLVAHPSSGRVSQVSGNICIHVLTDHDVARIFGAQGDYALPSGFGEGTHASFHRVLVVCGQNQYMLTPTSFIVVNSVNDVNYLSKEESYSALASALTHSVAPDIGSPVALISEITKRVDLKPIQLRCRVVTLYILILENRKALNPISRSASPVIDIPLAGFILDDGSSSCCCWATHKLAATLLRIHLEACAVTSRRPHTTVIDKTHGSTIGRLNKILRQHGRVVVKNYGSIYDSSGVELTFSVGSDEILHRSDKDFLRRLIVNASSSTVWSIVGSLMDSNAIHRLQQQLTEMGMAMLPVQHIWTNGVNHIDPLSESRERIEGLLNNQL